MEQVKLLSHHVSLIGRAIAEGRSPEEEVQKTETEFPEYLTDDPKEREVFVAGVGRAFGAIKRGDYEEVNEYGYGNEYVIDTICLACPPKSEAARSCQRKAMAQSFLALEESLSDRENLTQEDVISAYGKSAEIFGRGFFRFEVKRLKR